MQSTLLDHEGIFQALKESLASHLQDNPCRGIVVGLTPDHEQMQLSWIMGRSSHSQNRLYAVGNDTTSSWLETVPFDQNKVDDPRLIIYTAMHDLNGLMHVVSNGAQTDDITLALAQQKNLDPTTVFEETLKKRYCEPDSPIFTPRITGMQIASGTVSDQTTVYLSLLKAEPIARDIWNEALFEHPFSKFAHSESNEKDAREKYFLFIEETTGLNKNTFPTQRSTFEFVVQPGTGYCLTTYKPGHESLASFEGEPFLVPLFNSVQETMHYFWNNLEPAFRVGLGGKIIHSAYGLGAAGGYQIVPPINRHDLSSFPSEKKD